MKYLEIVKQLTNYFEKFDIRQILREDNTEADALANIGSTLKIPSKIKIPIVHIMSPAIDFEDYGVKEICEIEDPEIRNNGSHQESWTLPIRKYLQNGEIPHTEKSQRAFRMKVSRYLIWIIFCIENLFQVHILDALKIPKNNWFSMTEIVAIILVEDHYSPKS